MKFDSIRQPNSKSSVFIGKGIPDVGLKKLFNETYIANEEYNVNYLVNKTYRDYIAS